MNLTAILFDVPPVAGGAGVFVAVAFFLVFLSVAFFAFRMLRKTVKLAFRILIVGIILAIAVAGSVSFWWLGTDKPYRPERPRPTQPK